MVIVKVVMIWLSSEIQLCYNQHAYRVKLCTQEHIVFHYKPCCTLCFIVFTLSLDLTSKSKKQIFVVHRNTVAGVFMADQKKLANTVIPFRNSNCLLIIVHGWNYLPSYYWTCQYWYLFLSSFRHDRSFSLCNVYGTV